MVEDAFPHLAKDSGFYVHPSRGRPGDHAWNVAPDGTIVDTTSAQHPGPEIVPPNHPDYGRYISWEKHWPGVNRMEADNQGMRVPEYIRYQQLSESPEAIEQHYQQIMQHLRTAKVSDTLADGSSTKPDTLAKAVDLDYFADYFADDPSDEERLRGLMAADIDAALDAPGECIDAGDGDLIALVVLPQGEERVDP